MKLTTMRRTLQLAFHLSNPIVKPMIAGSVLVQIELELAWQERTTVGCCWQGFSHYAKNLQTHPADYRGMPAG